MRVGGGGSVGQRWGWRWVPWVVEVVVGKGSFWCEGSVGEWGGRKGGGGVKGIEFIV